MGRLQFEYEGKGQRCRVKWKSHNIRVELYREKDFGGGYPTYYHFELYVDDILRDSRRSTSIPHDWMGSSPCLNYLIVENNKEILLECYLQHHYARSPSSVPLLEKIMFFFGEFVSLFQMESVFKYGIVLHIDTDLVYSSAKWAKLENSFKEPKNSIEIAKFVV